MGMMGLCYELHPQHETEVLVAGVGVLHSFEQID